MAWPGARRTYQQAAGGGLDVRADEWTLDGQTPSHPVPPAFPSGYAQVIGGAASPFDPRLVVAKPFGINLPASRLGELRLGASPLGDPGYSAFPRTLQDSGASPGALGLTVQGLYIASWKDDARIGRVPGGFGIGSGAIAHLRPYHEWLVDYVRHGIGAFQIGTDAIDPSRRGPVELLHPAQSEAPFTHP